LRKFIIEILKPYRFSMLIMVFVALVWAVDLSFRPYLLKVIIDRVAETSAQNVFKDAGFAALLYFGLTILYPTIFRFYDYFIEIKMVPNLRRTIVNRGFASLLKQSYSYYQNNFAGSLSNKINDLSNSIPEMVQLILDSFFSQSLALVVAIFTLWQVHAIFAVSMLIWSIFFVVGSYILAPKLANFADQWSEYKSRITGKIVDSLSNILSVRLFARTKAERASLSITADGAVKAEQKLQWSYFWVWFVYGYSFVFVQGISLYFLMKGKQEGWVTPGDFVVVLGINFAIVDFLWQFTKDFSEFSKLWGKTIQALRSIQVRPKIQDSRHATVLQVPKGGIRFEDVQFHYPDTPLLFDNQSVVIKPGQKVGLVGFSGGGKSTFINLILRLYDVTGGHILIDKQDIRQVTQDSLHERIAMIPQDPSLFHRSLMDNIRYGRLDATDAEVMEAAKKACAHDFIETLPEKYETLVGERGVKISGGQRQRIAIARAILKNAPILILDEATSQLDSVTETDVQKSLWDLMQGKTTLVIAHRLSTLKDMDRILVFDQGKIVEDGTPEELSNQQGLYKTLWNAQVGGFLPEHL